MQLTGFKRLEDFTVPYEIQRDDLVEMAVGKDNVPRLLKVLLLRDTEIVYATNDSKPGNYVKVVAARVIDAERAKTMKVYVPIAPPAAETDLLGDAVAQPVRAPRTRPKAGEPTKLDKCYAIYAVHHALPKPDVIAKFVAEAGCTPMGANTYYLTCKNKPR